MNNMQKFKSIITISAILLVCSLFAASIALAATYWAAPQGSSSASCSDISGVSDPGRYGSFARAVACATASGDVVMAKPGTYTSSVAIKNPSSGITIRGSDSNPANWPVLKPTTAIDGTWRSVDFTISRSNITFQYLRWDKSNAPLVGAECVSAGSGPVVTNVTVKDAECLGPQVGNGSPGGFRIGTGSSNWTFQRVKISRWHGSSDGPGSHCFYWGGGPGLIENVECTDVNGYGVQFYNSGKATVSNVILRYNKFHNFNLRGPIYIQSNSTGIQIYVNVFYNYNTGSRAIRLRGLNTKVWNNTIYNAAGGQGILIECSSGCEVKNNIIYAPGGTAISGSDGTTISNNVTNDPLFVDVAKLNFRLKAQSQAIDKGATISMVTKDMDDVSRPQAGAYDIGAYEYVVVTTTPPVSPDGLEATIK